MLLKKLHEFEVANNDMYILKVVNDFIVTNDQTCGLLLFDFWLKPQKKIFIKRNLSLYRIYNKFSGNEVCLYDAEGMTLICISLEELEKTKPIFVEVKSLKSILTPFYYWCKNKILFTTYKEGFFKLVISSNKLIKESPLQVSSDCNLFFEFFSKMKLFYPPFVDSKEYRVIFYDDIQRKKVICYDFLSNQQLIIENLDCDAHKIIYRKKTFLFISDNKITVFDSLKNEKKEVLPASGYHYLDGQFINDDSFVLLSQDLSGSRSSRLDRYQII